VAEVRAQFREDEAFHEALAILGVRFDPISAQSALTAGRLWRENRKPSQRGRQRVVADFLIGSHAWVQADALLTRDRGFYRHYFEGLKILDPESR